MYIDSHAHLEGPKFDSDRDLAFTRAAEAGVEAVLCIGIGEGPGSLDCALKIAQERASAGGPQVFASTGIHPHDAKLATQEAYAEMRQVAAHQEVIAWGEIGLDYHYDHSPREVQQRVFIEQMELAAAAKKPIIIHCRPSENSDNAWADTLRLVREHWFMTALGGILHCFTGDQNHAKAAMDLGFMVSFAGNITYPKSQNIRDVATSLPLDRMLIETDAPFLAPVPHRGKRNEPAFVTHTAACIAGLRGAPIAAIAEATTQNFYRFFQLSARMKG